VTKVRQELVKQWDAANKPQELANAGNAMREYLAAPQPLVCQGCGSTRWECDRCAERIDTAAPEDK
jgi:hypothetical protein